MNANDLGCAARPRGISGERWLRLDNLSGRPVYVSTFLVLSMIGVLGMQAMQATAQDAAPREGFVVAVDLPLVGDRDERVRQQISRIADAAQKSEQRPIVVLQFQSAPLADVGEPDNGGLGTRGSQFERCLALARFLTSAEASRVRLIAYLPKSVEGHAVLPVLACEEILAAPDAELGRAAIDEAVDSTIESAYRDMVARRRSLPEAVVLTMLDPQAEAYEIATADGPDVVDREALKILRNEGKILREDALWRGGSLAAFTGQQLRARSWIERTVDDPAELASSLGMTSALRTPQQLPREWNAIAITIAGKLTKSRINQMLRGLRDAIDNEQVNLVVFYVQQADCGFSEAARLASSIADLRASPPGKVDQEVYTLSIVTESVQGPAALIAVACNEVVLLNAAKLGPNAQAGDVLVDDSTNQRVLADLAAQTERPLPLLAMLVDKEVVVKEYTHQGSGKRALFTDWMLKQQGDAEMWLVKGRVAGGEFIEPELALRYRLIDSIDESSSLALARLGVSQSPKELSLPWLDASIQMLLAQPWIPRLLLTIGFFALMAELGNPGIGAGGFLAALCFLGFFWIEGLNGNVEWLEVLLFVAGLAALAIEIFVVPGFGVFGIGGLLMVFVSVVLASQTFVWPASSAQLSEVSVNLFWVACLALASMIALLFMHRQLERSPLLRWIALQPGGSDDMDEVDQREAVAHRDHLLGQDGLTTTRLNPSGKAQFGHEIVAVVGTGKMIDEGTPVRVVEVRGNLVLVEER